MLTAYDNNPDPILTPEYGELVIQYNRWGQDEDGEFYDDEVILPTHYCTDEELGLTNSTDVEPRFLPIRPRLKPMLDFYKKKLLCTDDADMMVSGDYDSNTAQMLLISFNRCHPENSAPGTVCKSE